MFSLLLSVHFGFEMDRTKFQFPPSKEFVGFIRLERCDLPRLPFELADKSGMEHVFFSSAPLHSERCDLLTACRLADKSGMEQASFFSFPSV